MATNPHDDGPRGQQAGKTEQGASNALAVGAGIGVVVMGLALLGLHLIGRARAERPTRIEAQQRELTRVGENGPPETRLARRWSAEALNRFVRNTRPRVIDANNVLGVFAVSLGAAHGMQPGERVRVVRNGTHITDLVIDNVRPLAAGGTIPADAPQVEIRKDDGIVRPHGMDAGR